MDYLIILLVLLTYIFGARSILNGSYKPNIYSRAIWLILVINNFISVLMLRNSFTVLLLAGLTLIGNLLIFLLSLKNSEARFGKVELITTLLILVSLILWFLTNLPLLNLSIGIITHFIGGIPTYKSVIKSPDSEDLFFWVFFFFASILTIFQTGLFSILEYLYPLYFALLNGVMSLLCLRRYLLLLK